MTIIDVHAHYVPESCWDLVSSGGPDRGFFAGDATGMEKRLQDMDAAGIAIQVLSPVSRFKDQDPRVAVQHNDAMAEVVHRNPDRFLGMAVLPLEEPEQAAAELERCVKELGLSGATIGTNIHGENLDARGLAPFYAKAEELGVPIFIHPANVLGRDRLGSYQLDNLIGNLTDTAVAAASLIFGGVMKEFPGLKFYLAHGGGSCPYLCPRWDHGWRARTSAKGSIDRLPSEYLKRFYFDALTHSTAVLEFLVRLVGADRVMLGTDYPYDMGDQACLSKVEASELLSEAEKSQVLGGTAGALFKIEA